MDTYRTVEEYMAIKQIRQLNEVSSILEISKELGFKSQLIQSVLKFKKYEHLFCSEEIIQIIKLEYKKQLRFHE